MSFRDKYHDRESLNKWEAESVLRECCKTGEWNHPISIIALRTYNQFHESQKSCLFGDEIYNQIREVLNNKKSLE